MAGTEHGAVVLLPIKPRYATQIMDGGKRVEFRRRSFSRAPEWVVVYASAPVKRVVGAFRVGSIDAGSPADLWERYGDVGGIDLASFRAYFAGRESGVALLVDAVHALATPLALADIDDGLRPPQSHQYVEPGIIRSILLEDGETVHNAFFDRDLEE
ncbi:MAG: RNA-binding protein [Actinobacteria bacterium]|nr:RNA-binding protein [Actinomycetota bacterium]